MSILGDIKTQLLIDLVTTSLEGATEGPYDMVKSYPHAWISLGGVAERMDANKYVSADMALNILIVGSSVDQVETAKQEVRLLWFDSGRRTVLLGKGLLIIRPVASSHPKGYQGEGQYGATMRFLLTIEYSYA